MDATVTAIIAAAPQLGVAGILLALIGLLMRRETQARADQLQERTDYRAQIAEMNRRHAEELARIHRDHDAELGELRTDIAGLRAQLDELNAKLDAERALRRAAEDSAMSRLRLREQGDPPWQ